VVWARSYGGAGFDVGFCVRQTPDGGYIISGNTTSFGSAGIYLIKTNASGDTLWTKTYGTTNIDYGRTVEPTVDGGYIIVGRCGSPTYNYDAYVIKTDGLGDTLWTRTYGGSPNNIMDWAQSVKLTPDSGYLLVGSTESNWNAGHYSDAWLFRTDSSGNVRWVRTYGGGGYDYGNEVQEIADGYVIFGTARSWSGGINDYYMIRTDTAGIIQWQKTYGGGGWDHGMVGELTSDGGYIMGGTTNSFGSGLADLYLVKTDSAGDSTWTKTFGGADNDSGWAVHETAPDNYIIAGSTLSHGAGGGDMWILAVGPVPGVSEKSIDHQDRLILQYCPNAGTDRITISYGCDMNARIRLRVYSAAGQWIATLLDKQHERGEYKIAWDLKDHNGKRLSKGVYFLRLDSSGNAITKKIVVMR
jgi:hypothetical protein